MKCHNCNAKWSLECGLGPGGAMAPGGYLYFAVGLVVVGGVLSYLGWWIVAIVPVVMAALLLFMAFGGSGYQQSSTAYQGSECPNCGERNWIWPWDL